MNAEYQPLPEITERGQMFNLPKNGKGQIDWISMRQNSERLTHAIEDVASTYLVYDPITREGFFNGSSHRFMSGPVTKYYPGGTEMLRQRLNAIDRPSNHTIWNSLSSDPEKLKAAIESEVTRMQLTGISKQVLIDLGQESFYNLLVRNYPGGLTALRKELELARQIRIQKSWTPEKILEEARRFYEEHGSLTGALLREQGRNDLQNVINEYPGGTNGVKKELGVKILRKDNYWSEEVIENEVRKIYENYGGISPNVLRQIGREDLCAAIISHYPDRWHGLRHKLGIDSIRKPRGYWTLDKVEEEARDFVAEFGVLRNALLTQNRMDLINAIRKYPGGIQGLRVRLGLIPNELTYITPEEANAELTKLLEEI